MCSNLVRMYLLIVDVAHIAESCVAPGKRAFTANIFKLESQTA
jgi:hypothetical protein